LADVEVQQVCAACPGTHGGWQGDLGAGLQSWVLRLGELSHLVGV